MFIFLSLLLAARADDAVLTLQEAQELAGAQATGVRVAKAGQEAAEARLAQARGARLPSLAVQGNVNVWNDEQVAQFITSDTAIDCSAFPAEFAGLCAGLSSPITVREQVTAGLNVRLAVPLTGQLAVGSQVAAAKAGLVAGEVSVEAAVADARYQAADAWYLALQAKRQLELAHAQVRSLESRERAAKAAYEAGSLTRNDLLLASLALAQAKQTAISVQSMLETAEGRLGLVVGNGGAPVQPAAEADAPPRAVPTDAEALITRALQSRPDLAAARAGTRASDAGVGAARWALVPSINAVGIYSHTEGQGLFGEKDSGYVGATLDWTVFSGGRQAAAVKAAKAAATQAMASQEGAEAAVRVDVRARLSALNAAAAAYAVASSSIEQADENRGIQERRHEAGSGTMTELLDAEAAVVRARSNQASALYDARRAEAALIKALGFDPWAG